MSINEKITLLKTERGLNTLQLSNDLGVGNSAIYHIEKGRNLPSAELIVKICKYFNVSSDWLLGLKEERN